MKLKKMKVYSSVMMLGVLTMLNGCSSKEGTMTNSTSQVEYEQTLEESNNNSAQLEQDTSIEEVYNQVANILLDADQKLSLQAVNESTENNETSSIEAVQNINNYIDLLQKYVDSFDENKKYVQDDLEQINIKEEIAKAFESIINENQENNHIDKFTLKNIITENNETKLCFENESRTQSYTLRPTTEEVNNVISLFWGNTEETLELSKEEGSKEYYNFLSLFIPILKDFATNIDNYKISTYNQEYLKEETVYRSETGIIYNENSISNQINYEIQEALNMVKVEYSKAGEALSDYEISSTGEVNQGWIIRNKNNDEDYMILDDEQEKLIDAVGELQPIVPDMITKYDTIENIVILDNAMQAYQNHEQIKK